MKTYCYTYKGKDPVLVPNLGEVKPNHKVESPEPINHPEFEEVKETKEEPKKAQ